jgi:hypothetical protein
MPRVVVTDHPKGTVIELTKALAERITWYSLGVMLSGEQLLMEWSKWSDGGRVTDIYMGKVLQGEIIGGSDRLDTKFPGNLARVSE